MHIVLLVPPFFPPPPTPFRPIDRDVPFERGEEKNQRIPAIHAIRRSTWNVSGDNITVERVSGPIPAGPPFDSLDQLDIFRAPACEAGGKVEKFPARSQQMEKFRPRGDRRTGGELRNRAKFRVRGLDDSGYASLLREQSLGTNGENAHRREKR